MAIDYEALDKEADDLLNEAYGNGSPEESGTESTTETIEPDTETGTIEKSHEEVTEDNSQESTVPESRYKDAVRAMNKAQQELAEARKGFSQYDEVIQQLQQKIQTLETKPSAKDQQSQDDDEELNTAKELYGDAINPLLKKIELLEKRLSAVSDDVGSVKSVTNDITRSAEETAQERYWSNIYEAYPDVDTIAESPEYTEWYVKQPPMIKQALVSTNAQDVITALSLFRPAEKTAATEKTKGVDKLDAARQAASPNIKTTQKPTPSKQTWTDDEVKAMSPDLFDKLEDQITLAYAEGRIKF